SSSRTPAMRSTSRSRICSTAPSMSFSIRLNEAAGRGATRAPRPARSSASGDCRVVEPGPEFTLGIEEEYFLVDRATRDVVGDPPDGMLAECEALLGAQVSPEFLRSQIEIGTRICTSLEEAQAELRRLRGGIAAVAARHSMAP